VSEIQKSVIRHAQDDLAADPSAAQDKAKPSLLKAALAKRNEWAAKQPSLTGQLAAMWREGVKDVRQTLNETYFGKGEHMAEAGTPMNPTQQQVTVEQGNFHGYSDLLDQAANRGGNDDDRGMSR
jgi:hypothetical protein